MRAKNLDDASGPVQDWSAVETALDAGFTGRTTWLTTINPDGTPHVTPIGAVWVDGSFWFQTGDTTRKAKNVARDPRCAICVQAPEFDLVVDGTAEKAGDPADVARVVAAWNAGGWPVETDESGLGLTAPFNAPAVGPAPWFVYRVTPRCATSVSTTEPGGTTRWTF